MSHFCAVRDCIDPWVVQDMTDDRPTWSSAIAARNAMGLDMDVIEIMHLRSHVG